MLLIIALGAPICVVFVTPLFVPDIFDTPEVKGKVELDADEFKFEEFVALVDDTDV